jgi:hypothetical protein
MSDKLTGPIDASLADCRNLLKRLEVLSMGTSEPDENTGASPSSRAVPQEDILRGQWESEPPVDGHTEDPEALEAVNEADAKREQEQRTKRKLLEKLLEMDQHCQFVRKTANSSAAFYMNSDASEDTDARVKKMEETRDAADALRRAIMVSYDGLTLQDGSPREDLAIAEFQEACSTHQRTLVELEIDLRLEKEQAVAQMNKPGGNPVTKMKEEARLREAAAAQAAEEAAAELRWKKEAVDALIYTANQEWTNIRQKLEARPEKSGTWSDYTAFFKEATGEGKQSLKAVDEGFSELEQMLSDADLSGDLETEMEKMVRRCEVDVELLGKMVTQDIGIWLPSTPTHIQNGISGEIVASVLDLPDYSSGDLLHEFVPVILDRCRERIHEVLKESGTVGSDSSPSASNTTFKETMQQLQHHAGLAQNGCDVLVNRLGDRIPPKYGENLREASEAAGKLESAAQQTLKLVEKVEEVQKVLKQIERFSAIPTDFKTLEEEAGRKKALDGYSAVFDLLGRGAELIGVRGLPDLLFGVSKNLADIAKLVTDEKIRKYLEGKYNYTNNRNGQP